MAVKTREEIFAEVKARVGEHTDDETIAFLEDVSDTLTDLYHRNDLYHRKENIMAVKTREEILAEVKARVGEHTDDETIAFLEDVSDTLTDLETKAKGDGTDWKAKYEENDAEWRKKYTERFYSSDPDSDLETTKPLDDTSKPKTFAELFTTV